MIIGRTSQLAKLKQIEEAKESRFLAVYGRRRVGKTFLLRSYFGNKYKESEKHRYFELSGRKDQNEKCQLQTFSESFSEAYLTDKLSIPTPANWNEAFSCLNKRINELGPDIKHVLFFDELPWLAGKKSTILSEIDYFWNNKWSERKNITLIICGSAASWMITNVVNAKGGLYNRLSDLIHLKSLRTT